MFAFSILELYLCWFEICFQGRRTFQRCVDMPGEWLRFVIWKPLELPNRRKKTPVFTLFTGRSPRIGHQNVLVRGKCSGESLCISMATFKGVSVVARIYEKKDASKQSCYPVAGQPPLNVPFNIKGTSQTTPLALHRKRLWASNF